MVGKDDFSYTVRADLLLVPNFVERFERFFRIVTFAFRTAWFVGLVFRTSKGKSSAGAWFVFWAQGVLEHDQGDRGRR